MATIGLVNPQIVTSTWNAPLRETDDLTIRHSLAQLSSVLKRRGHDIRLYDFRLMRGWDDFDRAIQRDHPDALCLTAHTCERQAAFETLRRTRGLLPDTMMIAGGIDPTMTPQDYLDAGADYVLKGEGEVSLPTLIETGCGGDAVRWGEPVNLSDQPFADRELWPDYAQRVRRQIVRFPAPTPVIDIIAQRGCPWQCKFCCGPGEQNLYTKQAKSTGTRVFNFGARSIDHLMAELDELHAKYHFRSIVFHDDQFIVNPDWVQEFVDAMHRHGYAKRGVKFWAAIRADVICRHSGRGGLIEQLRDVGMHMVSIGFESFSDRMLRWMHKGTTQEQNIRAAKICRELGMHVYANLILGMPFEDGRWHLEDDLQSLACLRDIRPTVASASFFSPIPGSPFYAHFESQIKDMAPESIGMRFADQQKIFGVDYELLERMMDEYIGRFREPSAFRYHVKRALKAAGLFRPARAIYRAVTGGRGRSVGGKKL